MPQACTAQGQAAAQEPISKGTRDSLGGGACLPHADCASENPSAILQQYSWWSARL